MANTLGFDPISLPNIVERKGSLHLRSDHMKYSCNTLNSDWHAVREAEPKDYDISASSDKERNLLKATYNRIGNENKPLPETTAHEAMKEGQLLKDNYREIQMHKQMVTYDNFSSATSPRNTGDYPEFGYGSILPRHNPDHNKRHLETTHKIDYQYTFPWTPIQEVEEDEGVDTTHRRTLSEFTDTCTHRHVGSNVWQDYKETNLDVSN